MKRYFVMDTVEASVLPDGSRYHCGSVYHWMSLPGPDGKHDGGFVLVMMDGGFEPDPAWTELPHLLDQTPAYFDGLQHVLGTASTTTETSTVTTATLSTPTTVVTTPAASATIPGATTLPAPAAPTITHAATVQPIAGVKLTDNMYQIAKKLATINLHFMP